MPGILSDTALRAALEGGDVAIDPFDDALVNPASVDLTLGEGVAVYRTWVWPSPRHDGPEDGRYFEMIDGVLDVKEEPEVRRFTIDPACGWVLRPGILYLLHTRETITIGRRHVGVFDGKSSIGRLGTSVHMTAGHVNPGFSGQVTLEAVVVHPIRLYPGMRIAQLRLHSLEGEATDGPKGVHSPEGTACGAVPSRAWRQFVKPPV
jgi:dCTP deaminase